MKCLCFVLQALRPVPPPKVWRVTVPPATAAHPEKQRLVVLSLASCRHCFLCSFSFCGAVRSTLTHVPVMCSEQDGRSRLLNCYLHATHGGRVFTGDDLLVNYGTLFYTAGWAALIVSHIVLYLSCFVTEYCTRQDSLVSIQVLQKYFDLLFFITLNILNRFDKRWCDGCKY